MTRPTPALSSATTNAPPEFIEKWRPVQRKSELMLTCGERVENNEMLTAREAAKVARMSLWKFYRVAHGKVPGMPRLSPVRIGRRAMIHRETLERWLREIEAIAAGRAAQI